MSATLNGNDADSTAKKQQIGRPFQRGQSGNPAGRPKGVESEHAKLVRDLNRLVAAYGEGAYKRFADAYPEKYLEVRKLQEKATARYIPKDVHHEVSGHIEMQHKAVTYDLDYEALKRRVGGPPLLKAETLD